MKIISIDAGSSTLNISFLIDSKIETINYQGNEKHTNIILPLIDDYLKSKNLSIKDINGLCSTKGPGSFTGLRVAMATFKALSKALNIPYVQIPTLSALSYPFSKKDIIICIDGARSKYYTQAFSKDLKESDIYDLSKDELKSFILKHKGFALFSSSDLQTLADELSIEYFKESNISENLLFMYKEYPKSSIGSAPIYVRDSDAGSIGFNIEPIYQKENEWKKRI